MTVPKKDPECPKFLFIIILLVSIPNNRFSISNYCPFSFFPGLFYLLNFLNSTWFLGMRFSFINIPNPFKLRDLLSMLYLWSLQLTLT
jgi:hypothetical protein